MWCFNDRWQRWHATWFDDVPGSVTVYLNTMFCTRLVIAVEFPAEGEQVTLSSVKFHHPLMKAGYTACGKHGEDKDDNIKFFLQASDYGHITGHYAHWFNYYSAKKTELIVNIIDFMRKLAILKY